ncbi:MAG: hemerythrin domain-containing protein [Motilibacteraceae bacterium]
MARNVLHLLRTEHRRLNEALLRAERGRGSRARARDEAVSGILAHVHACHAVLHPAAAGHHAGEASGADRLDHLRQDDDGLLSTALELAPADPLQSGFRERATACLQALDRHARSEEHLLDECLHDVDVVRLRDFGAHYLRARDAELKHASPVSAPPRRLDVPRADLYEQARKAGVPGRSSMSREQLIAALADRSAPH